MRTLNPVEFARVEANLALVRQAFIEPALEHLAEYVETLTQLATAARKIDHDFMRDLHGDSLQSKLEFASAVLSARKAAIVR